VQVTDIENPGFFNYYTAVCAGVSDANFGGYIDAFFKMVYSLALADLGQATNNILARPRLLMDFAKLALLEFNKTNNDMWNSNWFDNETTFLDKVPSQIIGTEGMGLIAPTSPPPAFSKPPVVQPAVISQQYFCQVPQLKSTGSLLISIVVADLVFLQVLWKVFNMAVTLGMERHHPDSKHCEGCAKKGEEPHEGYELVKVVDEEATGKATGNDTEPLSRKGFAIDGKEEEEAVKQGRKSGRVQTA
jgi:hypothetical protein